MTKNEVLTQLKEILIKNNLSLSSAESCTGGLISSYLTDIDGASNFIFQNFVTYSNDAKSKFLKVKKETLEEFGAVSKETAYEMSLGLLKYADCSIATTGILTLSHILFKVSKETLSASRRTISPVIRPLYPLLIPTHSIPLLAAVRTTERMTAFMPGASPPEVRIPILLTFLSIYKNTPVKISLCYILTDNCQYVNWQFDKNRNPQNPAGFCIIYKIFYIVLVKLLFMSISIIQTPQNTSQRQFLFPDGTFRA